MFLSLSLHPRILFFVTTLLVGTLLILYIWQVNVIIGETYLRDSLLRQTKELKIRAAELSITHSQTGSLDRLGDMPELSYFERVGKINYIKVLNGVVVRASIRSYEAPAP